MKRNRSAAHAAKMVERNGFTSIKDATRQTVEKMDKDDPECIILKYLLENAVGRANSKSWRVIGTELAKMGIRMSKKKFQTTVLKNSRKGPHFLGSWRKGYFVIDSYEDFQEMVRFYKSRMRQEESNLNKLLELWRVTGVNPEGAMLSFPDHMNNLRCCDSCRSRHSLAAQPEPDSGDPARPNRRRIPRVPLGPTGGGVARRGFTRVRNTREEFRHP